MLAFQRTTFKLVSCDHLSVGARQQHGGSVGCNRPTEAERRAALGCRDLTSLLIDVETPALLVDADRLEENIRRWQRFADCTGFRCRPHVKTHKSVEIARLQLVAGAAGLTCQKLGEAEVMVASGADNILIPYNILGP